jgi:hypothetical protein
MLVRFTGGAGGVGGFTGLGVHETGGVGGFTGGVGGFTGGAGGVGGVTGLGVHVAGGFTGGVGGVGGVTGLGVHTAGAGVVVLGLHAMIFSPFKFLFFRSSTASDSHYTKIFSQRKRTIS